MTENVALVVVVAIACLGLAYLTYGRFLARRLFRFDPNRPTPAHTMQDGIDYVPTRLPVLFGHHFASIAGLGPILGPAIAVIWGWVPAVIWVVLGCIFIGALHDLGALAVSMRHEGRSVGEVACHVINGRARILSLLIIFFLMALAMGAFCNAIASLFVNFNPDAIIPSFGLIVVAIVVGVLVYRFKAPLGLTTGVALLVFAGLILWGVEQPVPSYEWFCSPETRQALETAKHAPAEEGGPTFEKPYGAAAAIEYLSATGNTKAVDELGSPKDAHTALGKANLAWIVGLLVYAFFASVLPVWLLLQPRDYINSFQLYFALLTLSVGLVIAAFLGAPEVHINAPAFRPNVTNAPPMFPILFVTIACGAVSGFHALVSSGTTVKQLNRETDALPIGYGAMLVEGVLAILVIAACIAGLGATAWGEGGLYADWKAIGGGLGVKLSAVVQGGAAFLSHVGIPVRIGTTVLAVTITAFAMTTLDSATRLLRFNVEELCRSLKLNFLANRYFGSLAAVLAIAFFALTPNGATLWTLFGSTNQLLAGLTLLTVSLYLYQRNRPVIYTIAPMVLMLVMAVWAMSLKLVEFIKNGDTPMIVVTVTVMFIAAWLVIEAVLAFGRGRNRPEPEEAGSAVEPEAVGTDV
ncbi:hypothetical protein JCM19992_32850 [Thermostilla marina]